MKDKKKFYINGQWVNPIKAKDFDVINPSTEEVCAIISLGSSEDTDLAEKSAETYLTALATGKELNVASHEVAEKTAQEWSNYPSDMGRAHLDQIRLILDKEEPDYQN